MKITIAAANGLIGTYLSDYLAGEGHEVIHLVRRSSQSHYCQLLWNPYVGQIDATAIDGQDMVINLAGKNVASDRWSESVKKEITQSRVLSTELIARAIARSSRPPGLLLNASAVGYYGIRPPTELVTEESSSGSGFMADTCAQWEQATKPAEDAGVRVAKLRLGVVLSQHGGALKLMLPIFRLGLGGRLASGRQLMSWIALAELGPIVKHIIKTPSLSGGINLTSPNPVSNAEFTKSLAQALNRPAVFSVPAFALKIAVGEMASEALLGGIGAIPKKLTDSGYRFLYPDLAPTLADLLP